MRVSGIRLFGLATAILAQGLAVGLPLHEHADHSAQVAHIEQAHGDHDTVVIQDAERQKPDATVLALPEARIVLDVPADVPALGLEAEPRKPASRPPVPQNLPRAPPTLL